MIEEGHERDASRRSECHGRVIWQSRVPGTRSLELFDSCLSLKMSQNDGQKRRFLALHSLNSSLIPFVVSQV